MALKKVKPVPDGYHTITPYLATRDASAAIEYYKSVFGAEELCRMPGADGRIGHAELRIGDSVVMLSDEHPEIGARGPRSLGGTPVSLMLYVADVDAVVQRAVAAGAKLTRPVEDRFYGDRNGAIEDPFGHVWFVATHIEDVPPDEMARRAAKAGAGGCSTS
jgi:PhnB protein